MTYILTHNIKQKNTTFILTQKNTLIPHILIIPSIPSMPASKCRHAEPIIVPLLKPSGPWIVSQKSSKGSECLVLASSATAAITHAIKIFLDNTNVDISEKNNKDISYINCYRR